MAELFHMQRGLSEAAKRTSRPLDGGGHGGDDGGMEARVAKLEAHVENIDKTLTDIKSDVRELRSKTDKLLMIFGAGFVVLATAFAGGFVVLNERLHDILLALPK